MRARLYAVACLVALLSAATIAQQTPASIRGRVVAAENHRALPRARVSVTVDGRPADAVFANNRGRFSIRMPEGSKVMLSVTKAGYAVQQIAAPSRRVTSELAIRMSRSVAVSGRVADVSEEPATNIRVAALRQDIATDDGAQSRFQTTTDDLGEYRLGGMPAGRYRVWILNQPDGDRPATSETVLDLRPGDDLGSIDFSVPAAPKPSPPPSAPLSGQEGTGTISGRVLASSGRSLDGVRVRALRNGLTPRNAVTDSRGRFTIARLPAGAYTVDAGRTGYVTVQYGQQRASQPGREVMVHDEQATDIEMTLPRGTAVTGTIVDEHGEPLQGVNVRAMQMRYASGRTAALAVGPRDRVTDDRGRYRLYGLLPGSYLIVASVDASISGARGRGYAPLFYPGTTQAIEASPITADLGRDVPAIDLVFTETPAARVAGMARNSDGTPFTGMLLLMASQRSGGVAVEPQRGLLATDGRFEFKNVPPGDYVVQAMRPREANRGFFEFGAQLVSVVDGDPKPLAITTSPGATMTGRLVFDAPANQASPEHAPSFMPFPTDFDRAPAIGGGTFSMSLGRDGTFNVAGLFGPTRFQVMGREADWYLKSFTIGGLDITDVPYDFGLSQQTVSGAEVVISNAAAMIGGHVTDSASSPVSAYSVIVFSTDRSKWFVTSRFLKLAQPAQDGSFEVAGLPPGEYFVVATDPVEGNSVGGDWLKPETLEQLSFRARRVTLMERERYMTVLRLIKR